VTASATAAIGTQTPATATSQTRTATSTVTGSAGGSPSPTATTTASPTTSATALPTADAEADLFAIFVEFDDITNDEDLGKVFIELDLNASGRFNLAGWRIVNTTQNKTYTFPTGAFIGFDEENNGFATVTLFAGIGDDKIDVGEFYWDQASRPWADGDTVVLRDGGNREVAVTVVEIE
jgi:hypothetical protein